jgi:hypothetical protein
MFTMIPPKKALVLKFFDKANSPHAAFIAADDVFPQLPGSGQKALAPAVMDIFLGHTCLIDQLADLQCVSS